MNAAKKLGFEKEKILPGFIVQKIGNTYSGSSPLGLCKTLDFAQPGQRILMTSFGSGAGSDAFSFVVKEKKENHAPVERFIDKKEYIDYGVYVKLRKKLKGL